MKYVISLVCILPALIECVRAEAVDWNQLEVVGRFRSVPSLDLCESAGITCTDPTYEGDISLSASRSQTGRLTSFEMKINGRLLPVEIVDRYAMKDDFRFRELRLWYPSVYEPKPVIDGVIGGSSPIIQVLGLSFRDEGCEFQFREIFINYDLAADKAEVLDKCLAQ